ncbi:MAG: DUF262 domain-containing protein [Candidatus Aminicenantes bacterium]|nr:DUF262 domain-containing protein [Candidatus Aminicenantes bacterium]
MSFQTPITVKEAIENIHKKKYLLPAIQREFVWDTKQTERLFDSLMRNYPIGSFLFWNVNKQRVKDYQFYEFIRDYHEKYKKHNPKADVKGDEEITSILDGQQRLTALYIGLKGTYAYKLPRKFWDNDQAFPERKLYLNLLKKSDNIDLEYDFKFITEEEAKKRDENNYWFKVGDILDLKEQFQVNDYLIGNGLLNLDDREKAQFANRTLFKLHAVIHSDRIINYFLEKDEKLDKVLNIFIRVNSGGTVLSYSDLLLSIATAQWQDKDAREEINNFVDEINNIRKGFNFNKDFVLKSCLILSDIRDIGFKVDNFNRKNMLKIEENWDSLADCLREAVYLLSVFGYDRYTLTSNYVAIPIAYYFLKKDLPNNFIYSSHYVEDRKNIRKWVILSLLKRAFGGNPDSVLRPIRSIISKNCSIFPLNKIIEEFRGKPKALEFNDEEIENLFFLLYGQGYTFSTLAILYPYLDFKHVFHIDHIYPRSFFTRKNLKEKGIGENKIDFYLENYDYLLNLQLLEEIPNIEKSDKDFDVWLKMSYPNECERKEFMKKNFIPKNIDLSFHNFEEFIKERKKLMAEKFRSILKL